MSQRPSAPGNGRLGVPVALALAVVAHWAHAFRFPFINDD